MAKNIEGQGQKAGGEELSIPEMSDSPEEKGRCAREGFVIGPTEGVENGIWILIPTFKATQTKLAVLVEHHVDEINDVHWMGRDGIYGSFIYRTKAYGNMRLDALCEALGQDAFQAALTRAREKWDKIQAEYERSRRTRCMNCGRSFLKEEPDSPDHICPRCWRRV